MARNNESHQVGQFFLLTRLGTKTRTSNRKTNSLEQELDRDKQLETRTSSSERQSFSNISMED